MSNGEACQIYTVEKHGGNIPEDVCMVARKAFLQAVGYLKKNISYVVSNHAMLCSSCILVSDDRGFNTPVGHDLNHSFRGMLRGISCSDLHFWEVLSHTAIEPHRLSGSSPFEA